MKHIKKFNEDVSQSQRMYMDRQKPQSVDPELADLAKLSGVTDNDHMQSLGKDKEVIHNSISEVIDAISGELEDYTNQVSAELRLSDSVVTSYGTYEYDITIKRVE